MKRPSVTKQTVKDLRFLQDKTFLDRAYHALRSHFSSREAFESYFNAIETDDRKNLFLKTASFYLFLVKGGNCVGEKSSSAIVSALDNVMRMSRNCDSRRSCHAASQRQ